MDKYIQDEAIILRKFPINESDLLLVIFTKDTGKILVKAKGAKKINSKFKGKLEVFNIIKVEIYNSGRSFTLTEAKTIQQGPTGEDLQSFQNSQEICRLLNTLLPDNSQSSNLYNLTKQLQTIPQYKNLLLLFLIKYLTIEGFIKKTTPPEKLPPNTFLGFYIDENGEIKPTTNDTLPEQSYISPTTIKIINFFIQTPLNQCVKLNIPKESYQKALETTQTIFKNALNTNIKLNLPYS